MIAHVSGVLSTRSGETMVLATEGGVGYEIRVPLGVLERLPQNGTRISLHTELVVREDGWSLYGFDRPTEREVFQKLLGASGFGPRLALALISALGGDRTVRSIKGERPCGAEQRAGDRKEEGGAAGAGTAGQAG